MSGGLVGREAPDGSKCVLLGGVDGVSVRRRSGGGPRGAVLELLYGSRSAILNGGEVSCKGLCLFGIGDEWLAIGCGGVEGLGACALELARKLKQGACVKGVGGAPGLSRCSMCARLSRRIAVAMGLAYVCTHAMPRA